MQDLVLHDVMESPEVVDALGSAAARSMAAAGPAADVQERVMSEVNSQIAREIGAGDARGVVWCRWWSARVRGRRVADCMPGAVECLQHSTSLSPSLPRKTSRARSSPRAPAYLHPHAHR